MRKDWKKDFASITLEKSNGDDGTTLSEGYKHRTKILKKTLEEEMPNKCQVEFLNVKHMKNGQKANIHMFITFTTTNEKEYSEEHEEIQSKVRDTIQEKWDINVTSDWSLKVDWDSSKLTSNKLAGNTEGTTTGQESDLMPKQISYQRTHS